MPYTPRMATTPWPIDLALSGGGFRAAGFHFGTLKALHAVGLLDQVQGLSTVSGGTIVGATWALARARAPAGADEFPAFEEKFYSFLAANNLANCTLLALLTPRDERPPSIIRAAARVYAEKLLRVKEPDGQERDATFGDVYGASRVPPTLCFNTTEFRTGLAFRFQQAPSDQTRVGNGNVWIDTDDAKAIRLADIVAASSCFPGGFEPLLLPDDFVAADGAPPRVSLRTRPRPGEPPSTAPASVALMDGGIYDNQGVDVLLFDRASAAETACFFISDTTTPPPPDGLYTPPAPPRVGGLSVGVALLLAAFASVVAVVGLAVQGWASWSSGDPGFALLDGVLALTVAAVACGGVYALDGLREIAEDHVDRRHFKRLGLLGLNHAIYLVRLRVQSLLVLSSSVFMKRVRDLTYRRAYKEERLRGRVLTNLVDELPRNERAIERLVAAGLAAPGAQLRADVAVAASMDTTLWWDSAAQRDAVIRAGEGSALFNLLDHVLERYGAPGSHPPEVQAFWPRLVAAWARANPTKE